MRNKFFIIPVLAVSLFISIPYIFIFLPNVDYYSYKELTYDVIVKNVTSGHEGKVAHARLLSNYIFDETYMPSKFHSNEIGFRIIDKDCYNDLVRGISTCDQRAWMLGHFVGRLGIDNHVLMLKGHGASELYLGGGWRYCDPLTVGFVNKGTVLASYRDICDNDRLFTGLSLFDGLKKYDGDIYRALADYWETDIFTEEYPVNSVWNNPFLTKDIKRRVITRIISIYYSIFGKYFANSYQDLYLATRSEIKIEGDYDLSILEKGDMYLFKARNYELFSRFDKSKAYYEIALNHLNGSSMKDEDALYFYSKLLYKTEDYSIAKTFFDKFINKYPQSRWLPYAYDYIGDIHKRRDDLDKALRNYRLAYDIYMEDYMPKNSILWDFRIIRVAEKILQIEKLL